MVSILCFKLFFLHQIQLFSVGDMVRTIDDLNKMKELQKGHGEWIEVMKTVSPI